jgi:hypothetical protein
VGSFIQIDLAAAVIAIVALRFSWRTTKRQQRLESENLRILRDNDVLEWGAGAIDILSKLESIAFFDASSPSLSGKFHELKIAYLAELSADKGRMYFPNVDSTLVGTQKDEAFRGYRRPILDALASAYHAGQKYEFGNVDQMRAVRDQINGARRRFVTELQRFVDPKRRLKFLASHPGMLQIDEPGTASSNGSSPKKAR